MPRTAAVLDARPVRGSAACEEAASAEDEDVKHRNHDTHNVSIKRHNSTLRVYISIIGFLSCPRKHI